MDFRPLFTPPFWFNLTPQVFTPTMKITLMIFFGAFALGTVALFIIRSLPRVDGLLAKHLERWISWALLLTVWGWGMIFTTEERVVLLAARFWFLAWLVVAVWWGWYLVRDARTLKIKRAKIAEREQFRKYLPKRKG